MMYHVLLAAGLLGEAHSQYVSYWQAMQHHGANNATVKAKKGSTQTYWQAMQHYGEANTAKQEAESGQANTLFLSSARNIGEKQYTEPAVSHPSMTYWQAMQHYAKNHYDEAQANEASLSATQRRATYDPTQLAFGVLCSAAFAFLVLIFKRSAKKHPFAEGLLG